MNRISGWQASPWIKPEVLYRRTSLDIPTVEELEEEASSVQDEEVLADRDNQQVPKNLVDGESGSAYLELASSAGRLSQMHMVAATRSFTLWMSNLSRVSASGIMRRKAWIIDWNRLEWDKVGMYYERVVLHIRQHKCGLLEFFAMLLAGETDVRWYVTW